MAFGHTLSFPDSPYSVLQLLVLLNLRIPRQQGKTKKHLSAIPQLKSTTDIRPPSVWRVYPPKHWRRRTTTKCLAAAGTAAKFTRHSFGGFDNRQLNYPPFLVPRLSRFTPGGADARFVYG